MVWVTAPDGNCTFLNQGWFAFTGQTEAAALGAGWLAALHPDDAGVVTRAFLDANARREPFRMEYRLRRVDGEYRWVTDSGRPRIGDDGSFRGFVGSVVDVTELKRATTEVAGANALLDAIFESAPVGLGVWNRDLQFQRVNEKLAEINGLPAAVHLGKTPAQLLPQIEAIDDILDVWRGVIATGEPVVGFQVVGRTPADPERVRYWRESFFPVRLGGEVVGVGGVVEDVTAQREAERLARESEARFRSFIEAAPVMAWVVEEGGAVRYLSPSFTAYTGLTVERAQAPGRMLDAVHPDDRELALQQWEAARQQGVSFEVELRLRRASDGEYRWFLCRGAPLVDDAGQVRQYVGANIDVHDQRVARLALLDADRRKDEFLAMLAHELRNPLAPIRTAVELLRLQEDSPRTRAAAREVIDRQVGHIVRLVDDLLDISRLSRGQVLLRTTRLDLAAIVRGTLSDYETLLRGAGLTLERRLADGPLWMNGDETRIAQMLGNLLHNARKFTPAGGTVIVESARDGADAVIRVRDTGVGIAPDLLPTVFDPFRQAQQGLDRSDGGLGLGLSLVHGFAVLHGGSIRATSPGLGRGAEFVLRLPLEDMPVADEAPQATASPLRPMRILVVEDHADAAETLQMLLGLLGHTVRVASNGQAALVLAQEFDPEVVLCDIGLPGALSGYDVARTLRGERDATPRFLVALTGYGRDDDYRLARDAGFDVHATKPIEMDQLERLLADAARRLAS